MHKHETMSPSTLSDICLTELLSRGKQMQSWSCFKTNKLSGLTAIKEHVSLCNSVALLCIFNSSGRSSEGQWHRGYISL